MNKCPKYTPYIDYNIMECVTASNCPLSDPFGLRIRDKSISKGICVN